ncbi:ABC transporter permease [Massilibacterium senegalense]|uniref:ABC transporter permease n=1 Tax=Massilibacterium senegalense TaxID=1632858 RepID=UPI000780E726|nr:ABC transporter permease [Massilibacterium senegalense]
MKALWMQTYMETIRIIRSKTFLFAALFFPIMFYYIFTNVVSTPVMNDKTWHAQYLMSMTVFSIMGSSLNFLGIRLVHERAQGWPKLMSTTPLPKGVYVVAKMIAQSFVHLLSIIVIFLAGYGINEVELSAEIWVLCGLWVLFAAIPFLMLGTLIGRMKRTDSATAVSNILYFGLAIVGGLWVPIEALPEKMQKIGEWLPSYWYGEGAWLLTVNEYPDIRVYMILFGYFIIFFILSLFIGRKQGVL